MINSQRIESLGELKELLGQSPKSLMLPATPPQHHRMYEIYEFRENETVTRLGVIGNLGIPSSTRALPDNFFLLIADKSIYFIRHIASELNLIWQWECISPVIDSAPLDTCKALCVIHEIGVVFLDFHGNQIKSVDFDDIVESFSFGDSGVAGRLESGRPFNVTVPSNNSSAL